MKTSEGSRKVQATILNHFKQNDGVCAIAEIKNEADPLEDEGTLNMLIVTLDDPTKLWQAAEEFFESEFDYFRIFKAATDSGALEYGMLLEDFSSAHVFFIDAATLGAAKDCPPGISLTYHYSLPGFTPPKLAPLAKANISRDLIVLQNSIWQGFLRALAAISRDQSLMGIKELELVRGSLVDLRCKSLGQDAKHWRGAASFAQDYKNKLLSTFPTAFTREALTRACDNLFSLFIRMLKDEQITLHAEEYEDFFVEYKKQFLRK